MTALELLIKRLGIHPEAVQIWDPEPTFVTYDEQEPPTFPVNQVLVQHIVPTGRVGVLVHWFQFIATDPAPTQPMWVYPLPAGNYWQVRIGREPIKDLHRIHIIKNPMSGYGSAFCPMVMYPTPRTAGQTPIDIVFHMTTALPFALFYVTARIVGFDFPAEYWDRSLDETLLEVKEGESRRLDAPVRR